MLSGWESVGNQTKGEGARKGSRSVLPRFTNCLNSSFIWGAVNIRDRWTACVCFLWRVRNRLRTNCQLWTQTAIRNKKKGPWLARWNPPWASILLLVKEKLQFPSCTIAASEVDADGPAGLPREKPWKQRCPFHFPNGQANWSDSPQPFSLPPELHGECKRQESWVLAHLATNMITMAKYQLGWLAMGSWDVLFVSSAISFLGQMLTIPFHRKAQSLDSAFLGVPGPGIFVLFIQTGSVRTGPAERVGIHRRNLHHLSPSGTQASGKLHVFVLH